MQEGLVWWWCEKPPTWIYYIVNLGGSKSGEKYQMDHSKYKHISSLNIKCIHVFSQGVVLLQRGKRTFFCLFFFKWNVVSRTLRQDLRLTFSYIVQILCSCAFPKAGFSLGFSNNFYAEPGCWRYQCHCQCLQCPCSTQSVVDGGAGAQQSIQIAGTAEASVIRDKYCIPTVIMCLLI